VNPLDKEMNPRGVENWLMDIEIMMKTSLFNIFKNSLEDSVKTIRKNWLFKWPS
jgi:hypothetical protein